MLDALTAASGTGTVANSLGGSNTDLNIEKLRETKRLMDAANVDPDGRCFIMHANSLEALLGDTEVTSSDFASIKALVTGSINSYMGFDFVMLGDMDEGGLVKDGSNDRTLFAFHKSALGMGTSMNQQSRVDYIPEKTSFLVASMFSAGAVAIEGSGIVKITCREA